MKQKAHPNKTPSKRQLLIAYRIFFGVLGLLAVTAQLSVHVTNSFSVVNFFSYFTNLSNIFAAGVLLSGAYFLAKHRTPKLSDDLARGAAVVAIVLVGIVYGLLLSNEDVGTLLPWVNVVVHYIMPVAVLIDWLYQPPRTHLVATQATVWLVFPGTYLIYVCLRGAATGWYPYPFLNPDKVGGLGGVAAHAIGIMALFFLVSWVLLKLGTSLKRHI
ncbi:MAG TPA: Pr6Pr family membrane protein [Candidatus Saccharimonadales bacterium]|nr:Pr6Pr family membrane protein [Candidatus Saccharimonadales bacterium]